MLKEYKAKTNGVVGVLFTDDVSGHQCQDLIVPALERVGLTVYNPGLVTPSTTDFTAVITKFLERKVDIVIVNATPLEWIPFRRQCASLGFKPKIMGTGRCMYLPQAEVLGRELSEGIIAEILWWPNYPYKGNEWFKETWLRIAGDLVLYQTEGIFYANFMVAMEAVKTAGILDRNAINEALPKIEIETPCGPVKFDLKTHTCGTIATLGQFVMTSEGKWDINLIWAPEGFPVKVSPLIFPLP